MRGFPGRFDWVGGLALALLLAGCSSESDKSESDNKSQDAVSDTAQPTDLEGDKGGDLATQDSTPDVAADTQLPDADKEVAWEDLPRLPADKTFTTAYAAGAARVVLNPDRPISMGGFGACPGKYEACRISEGIHDDIAASAVAIADTKTGEVAIFVGVDTVGMFLYDVRIIHEEARKAFAEKGIKFEGERIIPSYSHTHSGPDTAGIWGSMSGEIRDEEDYIIFVRESIVKAAMDAYDNLQDVEITWGKGTADNNDDDDAVDDEDVFTLRGTKPGTDETIFTWTRWVGHPTAYGSDNRAITPDYVGTFRKKMEETFGGIAVYANGPVGSVYTVKPEGCDMPDAFPDGYQDPDIEDDPGMDSKAACVGFNLADQAIAALDAGTPLGDKGLKFRHYVFEFHPTNKLLIAFGTIGPVPIPEIDVSDPEDMMESEFSWVSLGDLDILTTPGESFPSFADAAKKLLVDNGMATTPIVLGLSQDWMGYLMTEDQYFNDPDLNYNRGLSPGEQVHPAYMARLQAGIDAEKAE